MYTEQGFFLILKKNILKIFAKFKPKKENLVKFTLKYIYIFPEFSQFHCQKIEFFLPRKKINDVDQGFLNFSF